jgi:hypothetical protein
LKAITTSFSAMRGLYAACELDFEELVNTAIVFIWAFVYSVEEK